MNDKKKIPSVLITGASTGIGKACALHLDKSGVKVFAGVRKKSDGELLINAASHGLQPIHIDVTDNASIESAFTLIEEDLTPSGLTGLVNNAGIVFGGPLEFINIDEFRKLIEVNLIGAVSVTKAFLPLLRKEKSRIVNISSISGRIALPFVGPYTASKFGLEAITDSLRLELKPWKIPVSIIEPGDVSTPIWEKSSGNITASANTLPEEAHKRYGPVFKKIEDVSRHGFPPEKIAKTLEHALFHPKPKTRYLVGIDAKVLTVISCLPVRMRDFIISLFLPRYGNIK